MTNRKKKILLIQISIFISAVLLLYFTYSNKNGSLDSSKAIKPIENEPIQEGNDKKKLNLDVLLLQQNMEKEWF